MLHFAFPCLALGFLAPPALQAFLLNDGAGDVPNDPPLRPPALVAAAPATATATAKAAPEGGGGDGAGRRDDSSTAASVAPTAQKFEGNDYGAEHWGMSKEELQQFYDACSNDNHSLCNCSESWKKDIWDMHTFVSNCVKPTIKESGLGIALKTKKELGNELRTINFMVSHAWNENADAFFLDVLNRMHEYDRDPELPPEDKAEAFICSLALDQFRVGDQLGTYPCESPFMKAITSTSTNQGLFFIVPNDKLSDDQSGMYSRGWCIFEIYHAWDKGLRIEVAKTKSATRYLFGSLPDDREQSTRNLGLARNLPPDLVRVRKEIESHQPFNPEEKRSAIEAAEAKPDLDLAKQLELADSYVQLDLIILAAANRLFVDFYDKADFMKNWLCSSAKGLKLCTSQEVEKKKMEKADAVAAEVPD